MEAGNYTLRGRVQYHPDGPGQAGLPNTVVLAVALGRYARPQIEPPEVFGTTVATAGLSLRLLLPLLLLFLLVVRLNGGSLCSSSAFSCATPGSSVFCLSPI